MDIKNSKQKIILTSSLTTGRRFVKKQNLNGIPLMNFSIYTPSLLLKEKIIRLKPSYHLINDDESAYIILTLIKNNDYGLKKYVKSFGAASKLLEVVNDYRFSENDSFDHLIKADYKKLVNDYLKELEKEKMIDYISALILLDGNKQKEECYILPDLYLRPLEKRIITSMFDNFTFLDDDAESYSVNKIFSCYGQYDEVANLLKYLEDEKKPLGDIEVLYTDQIYENFIKGLCSARNVPYVLKNNHIRSSNYVSFIHDALLYLKNEYKYELLENVLSNAGLSQIYLKEFYKTLSFPLYIVGNSYKRTVEFIEAYKGNAEQFEKIKNFIEFLEDLIKVIKNDNLDYSSLLSFANKYIRSSYEKNNISNLLYNYEKLVSLEEDIDERIKLIDNLLDRITYSESDEDNALTFSPITKSFSLRKTIYVLGVNQTSLLGSDVENAFIDDVAGFISDLQNDKNIHVSKYQRNAKINNAKYYLSHSLKGVEIILSYSRFNKIDLRDMTDGIRFLDDNNSVITQKSVYRVQAGDVVFKTNIKPTNDEAPVNYDNGVIKPIEANEDREMDLENKQPSDEKVEEEKVREMTLSPSAVRDLLECPFRYYYSKILGIPSVEYPALEEEAWLDAASKGTFFHEIMELYFNHYLIPDNINKPIDSFEEQLFKEAFEQSLKNAEKANPVLNKDIHDTEVQEIEELSRQYLKKIIEYDKAFNQYRVIHNEYDLTKLQYVFYESKIAKRNLILNGKVDRIDGFVGKDGILHLRIVDYKTGKAKDYKTNNNYQHVLYSFVLEKGLNKLIKDGFCEFGKKYKQVVVDSFVYAFALENKELEYPANMFDEDSDDYKDVFETIDKVVIGYLDDKGDLLNTIDDLFHEQYPSFSDKSSKHGLCVYCKYQKECIKRLEWGDKKWEARK